MGDEQIVQNVATMRAKGATDAEVEHYLRNVEGLTPVGEAKAPRVVSESTRVSPRAPKKSAAGAAEGVFDSGMNQLTFGLHQKGLGLTHAILDVIQHGTSAHPIDTYNQSTGATGGRIAAAKHEHPLAKAAADATGFLAPMVIEAPIRAAVGLRDVAQGARGDGLLNAVKRVAKNAGTSGLAGAAITGIGSDAPAPQRGLEMLVGGVAGAALGGGASAVGETVSGARALKQKLFRPANEKGAEAARQQIVTALQAGEQMPEDLLGNARRANAVGSPARVAHLGGPALDNLSYLGASSMSPAGGRIKNAIEEAQRGESELLQRGVTAMSGRERTPRNSTAGFVRELEDRRVEAGRADYLRAYTEPPIENPEILDAIRRDPDLRDSLGEGLDVILREDELERLRSGTKPPARVNPLDVDAGAAEPTAIGQQLIALGVPEEKVRAAGHFSDPADAPALPIKLLDYMKRGVEPLIQRKMQREGLQAHDADIIRGKVQEILRRVDTERPAYGATRARQASYFGREEGARAGQTAFDKTGDEIREQLRDLPRPGQREAYRTTATSTLRDDIDAKRFGNDIGTALFDTPQRDRQIRAIYDAGARERIEPYLDEARSLNRVRRAATGGSQTEPRQAVRAAVKDAGGTDVARTVASSRRNMLNLPGKFLDAHEQRVQRALTETLAQELNIPADSPELSALVERLHQSIPKSRERARTLPPRHEKESLAGAIRRALSPSGDINAPMVAGRLGDLLAEAMQ